MVQQIHPNVTAPGGPHVDQAGPMMGIPPGAATAGPAGPMANAHAFSHLNPAQAHLFQQPQFARKPFFLAFLSNYFPLSFFFFFLFFNSCL